ncbi:MAG: hypothetical protein H7067_19430, partial [Burkholderiales bacterium]|nr:hypothetical protein [Opitutaceae bacterium]
MRLLALALALLAIPSFAATAPRVALQVTLAVPSDTADWQAALTAELVRVAPTAELVERGELARLWTERELASPASSAPAPLVVDRYLHFRRVTPSRWIVEHLDAATGRALGSFAVEAADL